MPFQKMNNVRYEGISDPNNFNRVMSNVRYLDTAVEELNDTHADQSSWLANTGTQFHDDYVKLVDLANYYGTAPLNKNTDFEQGVQYWGGIDASVAHNTSYSKSGSGSMQVVPDADTGSTYSMFQNTDYIVVRPGKRYQAEFDALSPGGYSEITCQIVWLDKGGAVLSARITQQPLTAGKWVGMGVSDTAPTDAVYAVMRGYLANPVSSDVFYVDNAALRWYPGLFGGEWEKSQIESLPGGTAAVDWENELVNPHGLTRGAAGELFTVDVPGVWMIETTVQFSWLSDVTSALWISSLDKTNGFAKTGGRQVAALQLALSKRFDAGDPFKVNLFLSPRSNTTSYAENNMPSTLRAYRIGP